EVFMALDKDELTAADERSMRDYLKAANVRDDIPHELLQKRIRQRLQLQESIRERKRDKNAIQLAAQCTAKPTVFIRTFLELYQDPAMRKKLDEHLVVQMLQCAVAVWGGNPHHPKRQQQLIDFCILFELNPSYDLLSLSQEGINASLDHFAGVIRATAEKPALVSLSRDETTVAPALTCPKLCV
ncbi:unnamed protein product, partial [Vitrella brassicaformis CCMP3155]